MASLKSMILFLAFGLILCSALKMNKHSQSEGFEKNEKNTNIMQTEVIGKNTGNLFDEWDESLSQVTRITIKSEVGINAIQIGYANGAQSQQHGSCCGNEKSWTVPSGEHIAKVSIQAGAFINSIQFITNEHSKSPKFGRFNGGQYSLVTIPEGYKIVGIFGGEGDNLQKIGFDIAPLQ